MNAMLVLLIGAAVLVVGYIFYGGLGLPSNGALTPTA